MLENYLNHRLRVDSLNAQRGTMTMPINLRADMPLHSIEEISLYDPGSEQRNQFSMSQRNIRTSQQTRSGFAIDNCDLPQDQKAQRDLGSVLMQGSGSSNRQ